MLVVTVLTASTAVVYKIINKITIFYMVYPRFLDVQIKLRTKLNIGSVSFPSETMMVVFIIKLFVGYPTEISVLVWPKAQKHKLVRCGVGICECQKEVLMIEE